MKLVRPGTPEWARMNRRRAILITKRGPLSRVEKKQLNRLQKLSHKSAERYLARPDLPTEEEMDNLERHLQDRDDVKAMEAMVEEALEIRAKTDAEFAKDPRDSEAILALFDEGNKLARKSSLFLQSTRAGQEYFKAVFAHIAALKSLGRMGGRSLGKLLKADKLCFKSALKITDLQEHPLLKAYRALHACFSTN